MESSCDRGPYFTTTYSGDQREVIGRFYKAWMKNGWGRENFISFSTGAGFPVPSRTLDHWSVQLDSRGSVLSTSKKFGLHRLLIGEDYDIFVGFAFHQYCENTELHLDIAQDFLLNSLGISMHESTVCRYLNSAGFSSHQARTKKRRLYF